MADVEAVLRRTAQLQEAAERAPARGGRWVARQLVAHRGALMGLILVAATVAASAAAPLIVPYDPVEADFTAILRPPGLPHLLGTDQLGRDILSRVVYGARLSLVMSAAAVALSVLAGVPVGLVCAYYGGWLDSLVQRLVDILLAFPGFLLALVFIAVLGVGETNVVAAVGLAGVPVYVRLVRGVVLVVREDLYVEAARALGVPDGRVLWRHVLPNAVMPVIVQSTLQLGTALLTAAGLGYLGLGVRPPTPEWGAMIGEAQSYVFSAWWMSVFPGLAIFCTVMAFNLIGDGLRDGLDPRTSVG